LKEAARLRRQFLEYFTEGIYLGDSVRMQGGAGCVKGYCLGDSLLVFVLNDQETSGRIAVKSDLSLWLPRASGYIIKNYDSTGELVETAELGKNEWIGTTKELRPLDMAIFEIRTADENRPESVH